MSGTDKICSKWACMNLLPDLVAYDSNWDSYSEKLYKEYMETYRNSVPIIYNGKPVTAPRQPEFCGKSESFWHIIGGKDNIPDRERCERIKWARAIIENVNNEAVSVLSERRGRRKTIILWVRDYDYVVILDERKDYYLLKTAYCVKPHKRLTFQNMLDKL